jgi:hypothetical protein
VDHLAWRLTDDALLVILKRQITVHLGLSGRFVGIAVWPGSPSISTNLAAVTPP